MNRTTDRYLLEARWYLSQAAKYATPADAEWLEKIRQALEAIEA